MYVYLHANFRLFDLAWDSAWTWYLAAIGVDFCYYWVHRACHGMFKFPFVYPYIILEHDTISMRII